MSDDSIRGRKRRGLGAAETIAVLGAIAVLSTVAALPQTETEVVGTEGSSAAEVAGQEVTGIEGGEAGSPVGDGGSGSTRAVGDTVREAPEGLECAIGRNGGATDVGVTGSTIKLGATVVETGIGSAFLGDVRFGMLAVADAVNRAGGICGRQLELALKDDGWDPNRGAQFIQNLVEGEKVFALAVVPSSEGLRVVSRNQYLRDRGVLVVGTDGMLVSQYTDPVIWPVASATISGMHIMAKDAFDRGAREFAIVYDANFRFGVEGAFAFNSAVRRLTGEDISTYRNPLTEPPRCTGRFCGIKAGQASYATEIQNFNDSCSGFSCDYILFLLEPDTAQRWVQQGGANRVNHGAQGFGGPQPLFNRSFAVNCGDLCERMWVWTGFVPPIERFAKLDPVAEYVRDLQVTNASADPTNSFVEGGYLGMKLLVQALRDVGPNLTRDALRQRLDSMTFDAGLSRPLSWEPGDHFSNLCMMAFEMQYAQGFAGWRNKTDWKCDPWPGEDVPPPDQQ